MVICVREFGSVKSYSKKEIIRLKFILKLKELWISLNGMMEISSIYESYNRSTDKMLPQVNEILDGHLVKIDSKGRKLSALRQDIIVYKARRQSSHLQQLSKVEAYAAKANFCFGVIPPNAVLGRS